MEWREAPHQRTNLAALHSRTAGGANRIVFIQQPASLIGNRGLKSTTASMQPTADVCGNRRPMKGSDWAQRPYPSARNVATASDTGLSGKAQIAKPAVWVRARVYGLQMMGRKDRAPCVQAPNDQHGCPSPTAATASRRCNNIPIRQGNCRSKSGRPWPKPMGLGMPRSAIHARGRPVRKNRGRKIESPPISLTHNCQGLLGPHTRGAGSMRGGRLSQDGPGPINGRSP